MMNFFSFTLSRHSLCVILTANFWSLDERQLLTEGTSVGKQTINVKYQRSNTSKDEDE